MAIIKLNNQSISSVTALPAGVVDANALASGVGGKVVQVVQGTTISYIGISSSTEVTTSITAQITPTSASNKILIIASVNGVQMGGSSTGARFNLRRHDTSTSAASGTLIATLVPYGGYDNASSDSQYALSANYYDTPNTTDARNYTITTYRANGSGSYTIQNNGATSGISLMEIQI